MSFKRDVRLIFPARDFVSDTDQHVKNLRAVEVFLETPQDWYLLLEKSGLPASNEMKASTSALIYYQNTIWYWDGTKWQDVSTPALEALNSLASEFHTHGHPGLAQQTAVNDIAALQWMEVAP